jgi:predicted nucleic acid-binding protein
MGYEAVVDSYSWVEYFRGSKKGRKARRMIEGGNTCTPTIVIAELSSKYHRENPDLWAGVVDFILSTSAVVDLSFQIAAEAGKTRNEMRKVKRGFGMADAILLETARAYGSKVLTGDRHFKGLEEAIYIGD